MLLTVVDLSFVHPSSQLHQSMVYIVTYQQKNFCYTYFCMKRS